MREDLPGLEFSGVKVARLTPERALEEAERLHARTEPSSIVHVNVHTLNLAWADEDYRRILNEADLVLNDGKGIMLGARLRGTAFPADLNGNLFTPLLLEVAAAREWPTFLLGAEPGVAGEAADLLAKRLPGLRIAGTRDGYFEPPEEPQVAEGIRASGAELVLVGLGNPRQERWLERWLASSGARLGSGVGAFFDFQTGHVPRAPAWMNRAGIEWVHRLGQEPRRLWRRYLLGNPQFLARVLVERRRAGRGRATG